MLLELRFLIHRNLHVTLYLFDTMYLHLHVSKRGKEDHPLALEWLRRTDCFHTTVWREGGNIGISLFNLQYRR